MSFDGTAMAVASGTIAADISAVPGAASRPAGYFWTTTELAALRAAYSTGGVEAAMTALPNRNRSAIYAKAQQLGVRAPKQLCGTSGKRFARRYPQSDQVDQAIRDGYANATKRGDYKAIAGRVNRPVWWVQKRAASLGVARSNRTRIDAWTFDELMMLEEWATLDVVVIAKKFRDSGFNRTATAVAVQLKRRKIDRTDPDRWTAPDLAGLLGVNPATVADWIERRGLKAEKKPRGSFGVWVLRRKDVKAWIAVNQRFIDLRRVDQPWFMDLAFGSVS